VVHCEVVDEYGDRIAMFGDEPRDRVALAALVGLYAIGHVVAEQLRNARVAIIVGQIGQDHHVGDLRQCRQRLARVRHQCLAAHFGREEAVEQIPHLGLGWRGATVATRHVREIAAAMGKVDVVRLAQPHAEVPHHVQQHLVAIADQQALHS
jgi:hypothetical protein